MPKSDYNLCKDCAHLKIDHLPGRQGKCTKKNCNCGGYASTSKQIKNPGEPKWISCKAIKIVKGKLLIKK